MSIIPAFCKCGSIRAGRNGEKMQLFVFITRYGETLWGVADVKIERTGRMLKKIQTILLSNVQMLHATMSRGPKGLHFSSTAQAATREHDIIQMIGGIKTRGHCTIYHLTNGEKVLVYGKST